MEKPKKRKLFRITARQIDLHGSKHKTVIVVATTRIEAEKIVNRHGFIISGCCSRLLAVACKEVDQRDQQWLGGPWWGEIKKMLINIRPILDTKKLMPKKSMLDRIKMCYNKIRKKK